MLLAAVGIYSSFQLKEKRKESEVCENVFDKSIRSDVDGEPMLDSGQDSNGQVIKC